ncbi:MAG: 1-acyl-sn-glycerol-3-phosphate acyltransferase [Paracoccaceae bacterium]
MTQPVTLPLWLLVLILAFAAVTFASHFLFPSVRWFFRRRAERVIARLNARLPRPIEPFKLARRHDMIQRVIYDPDVGRAISDHAEAEGIPEEVAFEQARRYAREIVPSFSATLYFSIGARLARLVSKSLYKVRVGQFDRAGYGQIGPADTVVFVINHRSNMDYVLVTHLVSRTTALSYAVGEWARLWPLSGLIRMMGAYFIRRRSRGLLYRRVLARYVAMATEGGVTQAVFPEGGLSLDGRPAAAKVGLLSYIVGGADLAKRDVVFVPVALNYDRVIEDGVLVSAHVAGRRRFRVRPSRIVRAVASHLWQRVTGRWNGFGTAAVSFGDPVSLRAFAAGRDDPAEIADALGPELMGRIAAQIPVLAIPLVSRVLLSGARGPAIPARVEADLERLRNALIPVPYRGAHAFVPDALQRLQARGLIDASGAPKAGGADLLRYYAASVAHHFEAGEPTLARDKVAT